MRLNDLRDLGHSASLPHNWRKDTTILTALQAANVIMKAHRTARPHVHSHDVKPIVEFLPIDSASVGREENRLDVFRPGDDAGQHLLGLRDILCAPNRAFTFFSMTREAKLATLAMRRSRIWTSPPALRQKESP